ncbi:MAG: glycoside hydrolase family 2 TIM barrel-domain containing protein [Rikenellaceae bacterium]
MNQIKRVFLSLIALSMCSVAVASSDGVLFNSDWRFYNDVAQGAEQPKFDDSSWREVTLPHDWAIEGPFDSKYNARCGGLPFHGTGWYRKSFDAPKEWDGKVIRIAFDGAMNDAKVWVNGEFAGERPYGYISFEIDATPFLKLGEENIVAVQLTPKDLSSRWYPGAGIYRNTWLRVDDPIHVEQWGVRVSTPTAIKRLGVVQLESHIANKTDKSEDVEIRHTILNREGESVATVSGKLTIEAGSTGENLVYVDVANPELWGPKNPYIYGVTSEVVVNGEVRDIYNSKFGIRQIEFLKDGFYINGEKMRFNGVCLHHDNGPIGAAFNRRADERKLQIMMDMGVNAIRTAHNPVAPEFLDLCDELGLVVLNEAFDEWRLLKIEGGYGNFYDEWSERDLVDLIHRDYNHPSVIMWSTGNEILEQNRKADGFLEAKRLADICRRTDPTRPSTIGFNYYPAPFKNNMAAQIDVVGLNYKPAVYKEASELYPNILLYGAETASCTSSRGIYHLPIEKYKKFTDNQVTSYDLIGPPWAYPPDIEFHFLAENPNNMGEFMWTGFDYLGEPTPYGGRDNSTNGYWNDDWPSRSSYFGAVDLCGLPKDRFYLYQSQWSDVPMVHLLPHWNWEKGMDIPVYVYTNCDEAELFLNGKSLGRKVKGKDLTRILVDFNHYDGKFFDTPYRLSWDVPFEPGTLTVKAYKKGKMICEKSMTTAGAPAKIKLIADRSTIDADGKDLSYITVRVEDKNGNLCPNADNLVNFAVSGAGEFRAVGNGNAATLESFIEPHRKAFSGMCMLIVNSKEQSGKIKVTATSKGLKGETIFIECK